MKEQVAEQVVEELRNRSDADVQNLGDEITKQLRTMRDAIAQGLDAEIKSIRDEVGEALKTKEQGESDAKKTGAEVQLAQDSTLAIALGAPIEVAGR